LRRIIRKFTPGAVKLQIFCNLPPFLGKTRIPLCHAVMEFFSINPKQRRHKKMADEYADNEVRYTVVVNHEEQYSIWFADREIPLGWKEVGKAGNKDECLSYIKEVWTDMRPLSLRIQMEEIANV
jgi:MbtH protein